MRKRVMRKTNDIDDIKNQLIEIAQLKEATRKFAEGLDLAKAGLKEMLKNPLMKKIIKAKTSFVTQAQKQHL